MKKVAVLFGVLIVFIFSTSVFAASFRDVNSTAWYYSSVNTMADQGIIAGYGDGTFRPNNNITRAEFVALLAKTSKDDYRAHTANYSDVAKNAWFSNVIGWATDKGVVSGNGNGTFAPNNTITRQDMACMIHRYLIYKGVALPDALALTYADAGSVSSYAKDAVGVIYAYGGVNGVGNNKFSPLGKATRAEACQMLFNNTLRNQRQRCALFARNFENFAFATGGASPASGFDNAGFVTYVYGQFGVALNGDATSLREVGTPVSFDNINMGDLVCFGGTTPLVGIYIGDGKFILSLNAKNTTSGVHIVSITSNYYKTNFVTARRMFAN